jgi:type II secretory pathway component PulF
MDTKQLELSFAKFQFKNSSKTRQGLWRKLAKLLRDGIPIILALEEIRALKKPTAPISIALSDWIKGLNDGKRVSAVVHPWVPVEESMLIMAGEQSGTLDTALESVLKVAKAKSAINSAVLGGLAYPVFLMLTAFGLLYLYGNKVIPAFTKAARGDPWHGVARLMIDAAWLIQNWLHWAGLLFVILICVFIASLSRWNSPYRVVCDRYPPYSIYRVMQGSSWIIALSALVQAGVRIESALEQLAQNAAAWSAARTNAALTGLRAGKNLGEALQSSGYEFPDREIISEIKLYASKSGFDEALRLIGNDWIEESVLRIKILMSFLFGVSLMLVGLLVAFTVSGLMAMQLQLAEILQRGGR